MIPKATISTQNISSKRIFARAKFAYNNKVNYDNNIITAAYIMLEFQKNPTNRQNNRYVNSCSKYLEKNWPGYIKEKKTTTEKCCYKQTNMECVICLEKMTKYIGPIKNYTTLPCGHRFHKKCIEHCKDNHLHRCPTCRR